MKRVLLFFLFGFCLNISSVWAASMVTEQKKSGKINVSFASFMDYPPIAYYNSSAVSDLRFETIFNDALMRLTKPYNWIWVNERYKNNAAVKEDFDKGLIDVFLGDYYENKDLKKVSYIYPAVLNNPVHVITLPQKASFIKTTESLKDLKGLYIATEPLSTYMLQNFKQYNIKSAPDVMSAYEKLFVGEIDFIIGSYYYNYVQVCLLGLKNDVAFSKSALWNMPMFISISKSAPQEERIKQTLSKVVFEPEFKKMVEESLREKVKAFEIRGQSVVPPSFVRIQTDADITPADRNKEEN